FLPVEVREYASRGNGRHQNAHPVLVVRWCDRWAPRRGERRSHGPSVHKLTELPPRASGLHGNGEAGRVQRRRRATSSNDSHLFLHWWQDDGWRAQGTIRSHRAAISLRLPLYHSVADQPLTREMRDRRTPDFSAPPAITTVGFGTARFPQIGSEVTIAWSVIFLLSKL